MSDQELRVPAHVPAPARYPLTLPPGVIQAALGLLRTAGGIALLLLAWALAARLAGPDLPGPAEGLRTLWDLLRRPFHDAGPNDKGIGLLLLQSLRRVFTGFALGTALAIPLGIAMGALPAAGALLTPLVQVLRPVSPLAWFPIGLATFKAAAPATVFVIFITSLWPTVINTALGVSSVPQDFRNVARVFRFSRWQYLTRVLIPWSLPHILAGIRISLGVAWMVIVAAEMLSGGAGVGFFVWDSWNALNLSRVLAAILIIGAVGLVLDRAVAALARRLEYGG